MSGWVLPLYLILELSIFVMAFFAVSVKAANADEM